MPILHRFQVILICYARAAIVCGKLKCTRSTCFIYLRSTCFVQLGQRKQPLVDCFGAFQLLWSIPLTLLYFRSMRDVSNDSPYEGTVISIAVINCPKSQVIGKPSIGTGL